MPQTVWGEAIEEGKRRMYEDAQVLEGTLVAGGAEVVEHRPREEADELLGRASASFGAGERAALAAFYAHEADALLTDDQAFVGLLRGAEPPLPALLPTAAIVALAEAGDMAVVDAREALGKIEPLLRGEAYEAAMEELKGLEKRGNVGQTRQKRLDNE